MARKRNKPPAFARGQACPWPSAELWFHPIFDSFDWLPPEGEAPETGTIAGTIFGDDNECTWDFDEGNTLRAMRLWHGGRPRIEDRATIAELARPWLNADSCFELRLVKKPTGTTRPRDVWVSDPLDLAIIGFESPTTGRPAELGALLAAEADVIPVARDISIAVEPGSGALRWILAKNIEHRLCYCWGERISRDKHGEPLVQALATLYLECARGPDRVESKNDFRKRTAPLVNAALDLGRKQGLDLEKSIESFVHTYEYLLPEFVIPPKMPPRR